MIQEGKQSVVQSARIICAGFYFFKSPKSGQHFPAFLVQFRRTLTDAGEGEARHQKYTYYYQWRTKRDFLLLKRFLMKRHNSDASANSNAGFPKSAYSNLCDQASWMRPLMEDFCAEKDAIFKKLGHTYEHIVMDKDCRDGINFHSFMNRSLRKMDVFLKDAAVAASSDVCSRIPGVDVHEERDISNIWSLFSREEDSEYIVALPMEKPNECFAGLDENTDTDENVRRASRLGQYFTSEVDASIIVQETLELCKQFSTQGKEIGTWAPFIFVEPSCGDGNIIAKLLYHFPLTFAYKKCLVLAYDIDENIVQKCTDRMNAIVSPSQPMEVSIKCCNFLDLSRKDLLFQISDVTKLPPSIVDGIHLVFIGNPPFTSGNGSGPAITRDLPFRFLTHSSVTLGASSISFLLPVRCDKEVVDAMEHLDKVGNATRWSCESKKFHKSKFHFQGRTVSQPSVWHLWSKQQWTEGLLDKS